MEVHRSPEESVGSPGSRARHRGRSAVHHRRRAWTPHGADDETFASRAAIAEEEDASTLIVSLQPKRHPGAGRLNLRDHPHKAALTPYLDAVARVLAPMEYARLMLRLSPDT